jgi:hypothetical protein
MYFYKATACTIYLSYFTLVSVFMSPSISHCNSDTVEKRNTTVATIPAAYMKRKKRIEHWGRLTYYIQQSSGCGVPSLSRLVKSATIGCHHVLRRGRSEHGCKRREEDGSPLSGTTFLRTVLNILHLCVLKMSCYICKRRWWYVEIVVVCQSWGLPYIYKLAQITAHHRRNSCMFRNFNTVARAQYP